MKDVTVTSFGLVIAYLLPGISALYTLSFWVPELRSLFATFLTTASNLGLFVIVLLASLTVGLIVHGLRAVLYEYIFCKKALRFEHSHFKRFTSTGTPEAFRNLVDEMFRYHQWWGALSIIWPFFAWGFIAERASSMRMDSLYLAIAVAVLLGITFIYIARRVLNDYFGRFKKMLEGDAEPSAVAAPAGPCLSGPEVTQASSPVPSAEESTGA